MEVLGAEVILDDSQLETAARRVGRTLGAVESLFVGFDDAARRASGGVREVSSGLLDLSRDSVSVNQALQLIDAETNRFISVNQALQRVGVQTTQQLQNQAAAVDFLLSKVRDDTVATDQLSRIQARLQQQLSGSRRELEGLAQGFDLLTRGQLQYSQTTGAFTDSAGRQIDALAILNQLGVQTEAQVQAQVAALTELERLYADDATALEGLSRIQARYNQQLSQTHGEQAALSRTLETSRRELLGLAQGIDLLTRGQLQYSQATGLFADSATRQASAQAILNQLGIQTEEQVYAQIAALTELERVFQDDAVAAAALAREQSRLNALVSGTQRNQAALTSALGSTARGQQHVNSVFHAFQSPAVQFGFIVNDLQQFSYGFSQGLRAISNNLGPLIATVGLSAKVMGPLILAIEIASTATVLWASRTKEQSENLKDLEKASERAAGAILQIDDAQQRTAEIGLDQARRLRDEYKQQVVELTEAEKSLRAYKAIQEKPVAFRGVEVTLSDRARRILQEANNDAEEAVRLAKEQTEDARALRDEGAKITANLEARLRLEKAVAETLGASALRTKDQVEYARDLERRLESANRFLRDFVETQRQATLKDLTVDAEDVTEAYDRLKRGQEAIRRLGPLTLPVEADTEKISDAERAIDELALASVRLPRAFREGLSTPVEFARARVASLESALIALSDAGETNTATFRRMRGELTAARRALLLVEVASQAVDDFSRGFGEAVAGLVFFRRELRGTERDLARMENAVTRAQQALRQFEFRQEARELRESFREGEIGAEELRLRLAVLRAEEAALAVEIRATAEEQKRFNREVGALETAFKNVGRVAREVLRQVIVDLAAAAVKAAILRGILALFTGGASEATGVGSVAGSVFGGLSLRLSDAASEAETLNAVVASGIAPMRSLGREAENLQRVDLSGLRVNARSLERAESASAALYRTTSEISGEGIADADRASRRLSGRLSLVLALAARLQRGLDFDVAFNVGDLVGLESAAVRLSSIDIDPISEEALSRTARLARAMEEASERAGSLRSESERFARIRLPERGPERRAVERITRRVEEQRQTQARRDTRQAPTQRRIPTVDRLEIDTPDVVPFRREMPTLERVRPVNVINLQGNLVVDRDRLRLVLREGDNFKSS